MPQEKINERDERLSKLQELRKNDLNPYPSRSDRTHFASEVLKNFEKIQENSGELILAGRLMTKRSHGNLNFANLLDVSGQIQIAVSKKELGSAESYKMFDKLIDMGDFVEVTGVCFVTHKGEKSIMVKSWKLLSKAIRPLPEKWHGLKDEEEKLRKRYLDIMLNGETRDMIEKRSKFWYSIRNFLLNKGFLEVETPVLEVTTGGADAKPFITHHHALDMDVYLRISAGELWQKRLMVAGLRKSFEIGRIFRNEGMSAEHLQDYTQCEAYWAYADYEDMYKFLRDCYKYAAKKTFGTLQFKINGFDVDLGKKWPLLDYTAEIKKQTGLDIWTASDKEMEQKLEKLQVEYDARNRARLMDALWKYC